MAAYVDYQFYTDTYLGAAIASGDFDRLALRASEQINQITFQRAAEEVDEDNVALIKMATCAVAEEMNSIESAGGVDAVQSERVGNYSVTYAQGSVKQQSSLERYANAARVYLDSTGLMYRGFLDGELQE